MSFGGRSTPQLKLYDNLCNCSDESNRALVGPWFHRRRRVRYFGSLVELMAMDWVLKSSPELPPLGFSFHLTLQFSLSRINY